MIENLKMAISENDLVKARRILKNELLGTDYPYEVFTNAMDLASTYGVFEAHDKEKLKEDPKAWTASYYEELKEKLDKNFSKERFMIAYYIARKLEKGEVTEEKSAPISVYDEYKDFFLLAQIGAAVVGAAAVGIGVWLYRRNKKK